MNKIEKNLFIDNLDKITHVAEKIVNKFSSNLFEIDELVNVSYIYYCRWCKLNPNWIFRHDNPLSILLRRVRFDMFSYMREDKRFKAQQQQEKKGQFFPHFYSFNSSLENNSDYIDFILSQVPKSKRMLKDLGFEEIDNKELIYTVLKKAEITEDQWFILYNYFYKGMTLKKIGEELGTSESAVHQRRSYIYRKVREASTEIYEAAYSPEG